MQAPTLGDWRLSEKLGRRREHLLFRGAHVATGAAAYLRVLPSEVTDEERARFLAEVAIASKNEDYFLPVRSLTSHGKGMLAVTDIPRATLASPGSVTSIAELIAGAADLALALQLLHNAGRIHGSLAPEAVECVERKERHAWRLLDIGFGLRLGRYYQMESSAALPPESKGSSAAQPSWDIFGFGRLGLKMLGLVQTRAGDERVIQTLCALFEECCADRKYRRPASMNSIAEELRSLLATLESSGVIHAQPARRVDAPASEMLTGLEAQWFVPERLSAADAAAIEGFQKERMSFGSRVFASLLSLTAGTALAVAVAAVFQLQGIPL